MTLAIRNGVLFACVSLAGMLLGGSTFAIIAALQSTPVPIADLLPTTQHWFLWTWDVGADASVASVLGIGVPGLVSFVMVLLSLRVFRRVTSAEIYFFALFLFALAIDQVRAAQLLLIAGGQPLQYGVLVTRVVIFGRLAGSFALFTASLYAVGIDIPRIGTLTLVIGVLAFVVVWLVPVDTLHLTVSLVHVAGGQGSIDIVFAALAVLTMVDYAVAAGRGHRERGGFTSLSVAGMVIGRELLFRAPSGLFYGVGCGLLLLGSAGYVLLNRRHYLWY